MKPLLVVLLFILCTSYTIYAQGNGEYNSYTIEVDGMQRQYTLYVPYGCDSTEALPLIFNFHMLNSNIADQIKISEMYLVADTAKFLIVYPKGLPALFKPYSEYSPLNGWNVPDLYVATQDDVLFISKIIDDIIENPLFNIDLTRIHATGISNGGCFSYYLAFMLSNRIASVASVEGQMSDTLINYICNPNRKISVLHMQGTNYPDLPVNGNEWILPLRGSADYWAGVNGCNTIADSAQLEDIDLDDNSTVTLFDYKGCDQKTEVKLYRINGGGHTWPGGWINPTWGLGALNNDINASVEIWNFFKRNPHPNPLQIPSISSVSEMKIYPNPINTVLILETNISNSYYIKITSLNGQLIYSKEWKGTMHQLNLSSLQKGVYFISIRSIEKVTTKKIVKL